MKHPKTHPDKHNLTAEHLRSVIEYDPVAGVFPWRESHCCVKTGQNAGYINNAGRRCIKLAFNGKKFLYYASHLAWLYMTGEWPDEEVDHENTNKSDDRWDNLRKATRVQNQANTHSIKGSSCLFKGVTKRSANRFEASIKFDGKSIYLGSFKTAENASAAYVAKAKELFGEFARAA